MLGEPVLCSFPSLRAIKNPLLAAGLWLAMPAIFLPAQQAGYTVHGSVLDSTTKQPIARALVQIAGSDAVLTDSNGAFEFSNVPVQQTTMLVRRAGYLTNQTQSWGYMLSPQDQASTFTVAINSNTPRLEFSIRPEAILTGRVSLLDADPADGIQIMAYRKSVENGRPMWKQAGMAATNSEGVFRIASLPPGSYLLYARPSADLAYARDAKASWGYPPVYFPGVTDASAAGVITLATGEHKQADITLLRQTFYPVTVKVANVQPGIYVNLEIRDTGGRPMQTSARYDSQQQTAHTSLPPGRYLLDARTWSQNEQPSFGHAEFTVSAAPAAYVGVTVLPLRNVLVNIRKEFTVSTSGPSGLAVISHLSSPPPGLNLNLIAADAPFSGANNAGGLEPVPGSSDGSLYQVKDVPPGKYWVEVDPFDNAYVSSISSGGVDLTRDVLTVGPGGASAPIEITLRNDGGAIDGSVTGQLQAGGEMPNTWIYAIPLLATNATLPNLSWGASGKFTFSNLAPGSYRVVACDSFQQIEFRTPEGLAAWAGKGQVVNVEAGSTAHVQLDIALAAEESQ